MPGHLQQGGRGGRLDRRTEKFSADSHIFLRGGDLICRSLSGLFIAEISAASILPGATDTTEGCGSERRCSEYESSKGQHCGIYIFIQKEADDMTCAETNNYCGPCSPSFPSSFSFFFSSVLLLCLLSVFPICLFLIVFVFLGC